METESIKNVRGQLDMLEKHLSTFAPREHGKSVYGQEGEYTPQSLKAGLQAIITDLRGITKAHNKFIQLSVYQERLNIQICLNRINNLLNQKNYPNVANQLDELKIIIRSYRIRGSSESQKAIEERLNELHSKSSALEEDIKKVKSIQENAEQAQSKIQQAEENFASFSEKLNGLNQKSDELTGIHERSSDSNKDISQLLSSAKTHFKVIEEFSQQIEEKRAQLESQEQEAEKYKQQQEELLEEASQLIKQSKIALEYTTAAGISAAYQEKYSQARKWNNFVGWLSGALLFTLFSVGLGFYILGSLTDDGADVVTAALRLTLIPLLIAGAWFCAGRYVKNKNLAEDYSYKAVLAKSLMAFMEKIESKDKSYYVRGILNQILQDPLRKRHDEVDFMKSAIDNVTENSTADKKDPNPKE